MKCTFIHIQSYKYMQYTLVGYIGRRPGSGSNSKVTGEMLEIVEAQMRHDDETTASQLHAILNSKGYPFSLSAIFRCRKSLGWTFRLEL